MPLSDAACWRLNRHITESCLSSPFAFFAAVFIFPLFSSFFSFFVVFLELVLHDTN